MPLDGLAGRLRAARAAADLTQTQIATALDCSKQTISHWEHGRAQPCGSDLARLARIYVVSVDWLLTGLPHLPHRWGGAPALVPERCPHGIPYADRCLACESAAEGIAS